MRIAGWICLILGLFSFLGAAEKEESVIGSLLIIGLGAFLLYKTNERHGELKQQNQETILKEAIKNNKMAQYDDQYRRLSLKLQPEPQKESLAEIQSQLTLEQREAAMCLISFFGGFNNNMDDDAPMTIFKQAGAFFGIATSPAATARIMQKFPNADILIDTVLTIRPTKAKEFLLLTCYDLIKPTRNSDAFEILYNIANDMGYSKTRFENLINAYK